MIITIPTDGLAPNGTRPSAGTVLTTNLHKVIGKHSTDCKVMLTHCGLVTPYGDMELGQHWLR